MHSPTDQMKWKEWKQLEEELLTGVVTVSWECWPLPDLLVCITQFVILVPLSHLDRLLRAILLTFANTSPCICVPIVTPSYILNNFLRELFTQYLVLLKFLPCDGKMSNVECIILHVPYGQNKCFILRLYIICLTMQYVRL